MHDSAAPSLTTSITATQASHGSTDLVVQLFDLVLFACELGLQVFQAGGSAAFRCRCLLLLLLALWGLACCIVACCSLIFLI
jgi:hypothetical protein